MKTEFVIVDIDGTVADLRHRIHFIQGEKKDWDAYNIGLISDSALQNAACYHLMRAIVETRPNTPYCALVAEVAKATFSTESRVRNLMCVDYYGTPIQDLRKSLKLK